MPAQSIRRGLSSRHRHGCLPAAPRREEPSHRCRPRPHKSPTPHQNSCRHPSRHNERQAILGNPRLRRAAPAPARRRSAASPSRPRPPPSHHACRPPKPPPCPEAISPPSQTASTTGRTPHPTDRAVSLISLSHGPNHPIRARSQTQNRRRHSPPARYSRANGWPPSSGRGPPRSPPPDARLASSPGTTDSTAGAPNPRSQRQPTSHPAHTQPSDNLRSGTTRLHAQLRLSG